MSPKIHGEIALVIGAVIAALEAVAATVPDVSDTFHVVLAVLIAVAGAVGIRQNVTPV